METREAEGAIHEAQRRIKWMEGGGDEENAEGQFNAQFSSATASVKNKRDPMDLDRKNIDWQLLEMPSLGQLGVTLTSHPAWQRGRP